MFIKLYFLSRIGLSNALGVPEINAFKQTNISVILLHTYMNSHRIILLLDRLFMVVMHSAIGTGNQGGFIVFIKLARNMKFTTGMCSGNYEACFFKNV